MGVVIVFIGILTIFYFIHKSIFRDLVGKAVTINTNWRNPEQEPTWETGIVFDQILFIIGLHRFENRHGEIYYNIKNGCYLYEEETEETRRDDQKTDSSSSEGS